MAQNKKRGTLPSPLAGALSELAARGQDIFEISEFAEVLGIDRDRARKLLYRLRQSGWVAQITRGKYLIIPLEAGPEATWSEDALVIACHLAEPASVAYWSACHYWGWTEQAPRTVFVQTTQRKMRTIRVVLGVQYKFVRVHPRKFFGHLKRTVERGMFTITDREKTLIDALDHPELCGGIRLVMEMLPVAEDIDWDKVDRYLERTGSGAIYKRLGFLAERLGTRLALPDRDRRLARWQSRLTGGYAPLDPQGPPGGKTDSRWRVRVNVPGVANGSATP
jgi:predicted transcriptional regulator of viral defense system